MPAQDPELLELVNRLHGGDGVIPLSDEELSGLRGQVTGILAEIPRENPSDSDLEVATEGASVIKAVDAEIAKRGNVEARRAQAIAKIVDAALGDGPAAVAPVAASGLPSISQLAARMPRMPRRSRPVSRHSGPELLTASGGPIGDVTPTQYIADALKRELGRDRADGKVVIATMRAEFPPERTLDENAPINDLKLTAAAQADTALLASGGICGPVAADYTVSAIATADRPVRSGLTQFGAARGGIRFVAPHTLAQVHADGPNSVWTQATDAAPGNSVKGYSTYSCQSVQEVYVDAIVQQVRFGNFQQRYFPEQLDQYLATADADHSRLAESTALGAMLTASTLVNGALNQLGAASDYLAHIDLAVAGYRYRHRMPMDAPLQLFYPEWFEDELRADLARELPGNSGGQSERLAVADAEIGRFFTTRNLSVTTFLDNVTGASPAQSWVAQGVGDLLPWPTKVLSFIFHPGAFIFLDGGELNLGIIRDSTLNATNQVTFFKESFEKVVYRGHESIALMLDLCPSGARQSVVDVSTQICSAGS